MRINSNYFMPIGLVLLTGGLIALACGKELPSDRDDKVETARLMGEWQAVPTENPQSFVAKEKLYNFSELQFKADGIFQGILKSGESEDRFSGSYESNENGFLSLNSLESKTLAFGLANPHSHEILSVGEDKLHIMWSASGDRKVKQEYKRIASPDFEARWRTLEAKAVEKQRATKLALQKAAQEAAEQKAQAELRKIAEAKAAAAAKKLAAKEESSDTKLDSNADPLASPVSDKSFGFDAAFRADTPITD